MSQIVFGPFFSRTATSKTFAGFKALGVNLEFASNSHSANLPLYERENPFTLAGPGNYFIPANKITWKIVYRPFFSVQVDGVLMLPLDEVLLSVFNTFTSPRDLRTILTEFREYLEPAKKSEPNRWYGRKLIIDKAEKEGIRLIEVFAYGRSQHLSFRWVPPQDAEQEESPLAISIGGFELWAQPDGEFSQGKWRKFRTNSHIGALLRKELGSILKLPPITLLTEEGLEVAKKEFNWQPVHLMTPKELKAARIEFVKSHSDLWSDHKTLAKALQEARLYQKETDLGHIRRSIPKFLEEAQKAKTDC